MIVRRVIALHTKKHQAPLLMSFRAIVKNPHPSSLAPSLRELSPKVTEGVFPSRTRMGRRILRPYGLRMAKGDAQDGAGVRMRAYVKARAVPGAAPSVWNSVISSQYRLGMWVMRHRGFSRSRMAMVS